MITSIIGRRFLDHYNQQRATQLTPKEFFEKIYFPLFYGHPKYMQWVSNSPFVQMKKNQKPYLLTPLERIEKLGNLANKIESGEIDASTAIGYPASEDTEFATTSGQVTDLNTSHDTDAVYCSWIGSGFGMGVAGGQLILFDHPALLEAIFEGWAVYRADLNDPAYDNLAGNQIATWNGQWLVHRLGPDYRAQDVRQNFAPYEKEADGSLRVGSQTWLRVVLGIARTMSLPRLTGYVYKHGQMNSTYGFIPFELPQIKRPSELYIKLFGDYAYQRDAAKIEALYGSARSFQAVCQRGSIGVAALEPKGLSDLMPTGRGEVKNFKYNSTDQDNQFTFNTYVTWLLAMLNNDEFWDEAGRAAGLFLRYEQGAGKLKSDRDNQVEKARNAVGKRQFLDAMVVIMENADSKLLDELEGLAMAIHKLPNDNFPYFQTLIRLRYARQSREVTPNLFSNN